MTRDFLKPQKTTGLDTNAPVGKRSRFAPDPKPVQAKQEQPDFQTILQRSERVDTPLQRMIQAQMAKAQSLKQQEEEKEENLQTKPESTIQPQELEEEEETLQTKAEPTLQREELPEEEDETVQTKLTIGQPGDKYEQEADNMASQVMSMADPTAENVQRQEMEEEETLQQKPLADNITPVVQRQTSETQPQDNTSQNLESQLATEKGGGSPLSDEVRGFMEPRFGTDFSQVRVHTGSAAVQMNQQLGAQAFTHGNDIYYGKGKAPGNDALTAHELTHTIQQVALSQNIQRQADMSFTLEETERLDIRSLEQTLKSGQKGDFFGKLRKRHRLKIFSSRRDINDLIWRELSDDDRWLALKLLWYGSEAKWPIHLRVELAMKRKEWGQSRGKGEVFDILRNANGLHKNNRRLTNTLKKLFRERSQDLWWAIQLQKYGSESSFPDHDETDAKKINEGKPVDRTTGKDIDNYLKADSFLHHYVKTQIQSGFSVEGNVHVHPPQRFRQLYIEYAVKLGNTLSVATKDSKRVNAYRDENEIHVNLVRGDFITTIHESMHFFSHDKYREELGKKINEGTTEFFTHWLCKRNGINIRKITPDRLKEIYTNEYHAIYKLREVSGNSVLAKAYFQGDVDGLRNKVNSLLGGNAFDKWVRHMKAGQYNKANAMLSTP